MICSHDDTRRDENDVPVCYACGAEVETLDFRQEWSWRGAEASKDPSRCHPGRPARRGVRATFEAKGIDVFPALTEMVELKYQEILKKEGRVLRGKGREATIAACLYHSFQEVGEHRPERFARELLGVRKKDMTGGMRRYLDTFGEADKITPEKLVPWIMRITGADESLEKEVLFVLSYAKRSSEAILRSRPQELAAAVLFCCLSKRGKVCSKTEFAKRASVSEAAFSRLVEEVSSL